VKHDIKKELGFFHPKEGLEEDEVAGTADWQEFGQTLYYSEKDGLKEINIGLRKNLPSLGGRGLRGGGIEPYSPLYEPEAL
jgi:hypothetical protein